MTFMRLGSSKLRVLTLIATLPVFALRCGGGDGESPSGTDAGESSGAEGGTQAQGGTSSSGTAGIDDGARGGTDGAGVGDAGGTSQGAGDAGGAMNTASGGQNGESGEGGGSNVAVSDLVEVPNAEFTNGEPPQTNNAGELPAIDGLMGPSATTNGGTTTIRIELDGKPKNPTFVVVIEGDNGYFIATATDANEDGIYELEIRVGADVDVTKLTVRIAPIDGAGNVGAYQTVEYEIVQSGVGEVKVTLSFDRDADLDLHVVEPGGFEVFFDTQSSPSGGELDLDSNANCVVDGKNTENVFWPTDAAPDGTYQVWVKYFDSCEVTETVGYTVTVYNGPGVETFRGSFTPEASGEKRLITSFVH